MNCEIMYAFGIMCFLHYCLLFILVTVDNTCFLTKSDYVLNNWMYQVFYITDSCLPVRIGKYVTHKFCVMVLINILTWNNSGTCFTLVNDNNCMLLKVCVHTVFSNDMKYGTFWPWVIFCNCNDMIISSQKFNLFVLNFFLYFTQMRVLY